MDRSILVVALVLGSLGISRGSASAPAAVQAPVDRNYTGPVTDPSWVCFNKRTVQPHTSYTETYQGKTYHFCCTMCLSKFKANPDDVRWANDPVNGKKIDKADAKIYSYEGRAYFFASNRTMNKFAKNPLKYKEPSPAAPQAAVPLTPQTIPTATK
jgi:YHS domain-containing protein